MPEATVAEQLRRIAEIDAAFATATGWGSWMVMCANEREGLVNRLRDAGRDVAYSHLARASDGRPVD